MGNTERIRMEPLADSVFSYLFSDKDTTVSMREIINNVLTSSDDDPIKEITRMDSQYSVIGDKIGARGGRLDIRAVAEDNSLFDIEVQLSSQLYMNDRSWFYGGRLLSESFREGEDYRKMPRVRVINLLDFVLREDHGDYLQPVGVMYKKAPVVVATDAFRIYNIELPKFRASYPTLESAKKDPLASWLYLLNIGYKDEREMEVLMEMSEGMRAFAKKYNRSLKDPKLRDLYEYDLSARRDQAAIAYTAEMRGEARGEVKGEARGLAKGLVQGEAKGLAKGLAKGEAQGLAKGLAQGEAQGLAKARTAMIQKMLDKGLSVDLIYDCVDAPRSEIDAIIAKIRADNRA